MARRKLLNDKDISQGRDDPPLEIKLLENNIPTKNILTNIR
jgi:hypothetical protein